ncbi:LON peptidase N-terminal domain and RING finger protein 2, partial [Frankliniella fusca]
GHYRRGAALTALSRYEEALCAFCTCAALERGPQGPQAVRGEVTRVLHRLLSARCSPRSRAAAAAGLRSAARAGLGGSRGAHWSGLGMGLGHGLSRLQGMAWRAPPPCSSDCEDNSSDEDCSAAVGMQAQPKVAARGAGGGGGRGPGRGVSRAGANGLSHGPPQHQHLQDLSGVPAPTDPYLDTLLDRVFQDVEKIKRLEGRDPPGDALVVDPRLVDHSELDCVLCCRTLWKPVTTPCGHTYCCMCLDRCLDYSFSCPLCMTSLSEYVAASPRSVTEWVEAALLQAAPRELAQRQVTHAQELSEQGPVPIPVGPLMAVRRGPGAAPGLGACPMGLPVPIFVCTTGFPGVPCPLYVYEPRYRLMVRRCVESGARTFGMAACVYRSGGPDRYAEYGTLLEICDLVRMCDGSSILSTLGSRRFRVLQRGERDGYDVANVQLLQDEPTSAERLPGVRQLHGLVRAKSELWLSSMGPELRDEIERSFGVMPDVEDGWENSCDGPRWTWYLLAVLPLGPQLQVGILSTTSVEKRLRAIGKTLDHLAQRLRAPRTSPSPASAQAQAQTDEQGEAQQQQQQRQWEASPS